MDKKLQEGQKLWWVYSSNRRGQPREVTVTKVGRKWAQLDNNCRIDIETLLADGGDYMSPGCCYLSKDIYDSGVALQKAWSEMKRDIQYASTPEGVTVVDIQAARTLLRMPSNAEISARRCDGLPGYRAGTEIGDK